MIVLCYILSNYNSKTYYSMKKNNDKHIRIQVDIYSNKEYSYNDFSYFVVQK